MIFWVINREEKIVWISQVQVWLYTSTMACIKTGLAVFSTESEGQNLWIAIGWLSVLIITSNEVLCESWSRFGHNSWKLKTSLFPFLILKSKENLNFEEIKIFRLFLLLLVTIYRILLCILTRWKRTEWLCNCKCIYSINVVT